MRSRRKLLLLLPMVTLAGALALADHATLPPLGQRQASTAPVDTDATRLGQAALALMAPHPGLAGIHPLVEGQDAFTARALLAEAAERTLDLQYYIWRKDTTGILLFESLRRAADRGVRVRLLLDDNNSGGLDAMLAQLDAHPLVEIRLFNPSVHRKLRFLGYLTDFARLNRRMHNKSFTVDNQVSIVGGRNIGDEYFDAASDLSFADLDVMTIGPVVKAVSSDFDQYWNSASAYPLALLVGPGEAGPVQVRSAQAGAYLDAVRRSSFIEQLVRGTLPFEWGRTRLVSDDPAKVMGKTAREAHVMHKLAALFGKPQRNLDLVSPYFVPGREGAEAFMALAREGAAVRILTNSLEATDVAAVHAGYASWREPLLKAGVSLYELRREWGETPRGQSRDKSHDGRLGPLGSSAASLHAKTFAVDGQRVFVGSFNVDQRSFHLNTEMGLVVDSPALARSLSETLDRVVRERAYEVRLGENGKLYWIERKQGKLIRHEVEPGTRWWKRAAVKTLSWLPIEWLL